jgi:DNA polymerase-1
MARALGVPTLVEQGVEADDLIASCAMDAVRNGHTVTILTSDRDLLQLLDTEGVQIWFPVRGGKNRVFEKWNRERFVSEYGFPPERFPDYMALRGDPSDNIPGLPGVGEKTAMKLITDFGALEDIYEKIADVKPDKLRENLTANRDNAFLYRRLVRLKRDCEAASRIDWHGSYPIRLDSMEFRAFAERLGLKRYIR